MRLGRLIPIAWLVTVGAGGSGWAALQEGEPVARWTGETLVLYTDRGEPLATLLPPEASLGAPADRWVVRDPASGRTSYQAGPPVPLQPLALAGASREGNETLVRYRAERFEVLLRLADLPGKPYARLRLAVRWTGAAEPSPHDLGREVQVKLRFQMVAGALRRAVSFPQLKFVLQPTDLALDEEAFAAHWGCQGFRFEETERSLNLPALAAADGAEYVVLLCEPRSSFTLGAGDACVSASRRCFVVPRPGAVDESLEIGDGEPPAHHDLYLGRARAVSWDDLYWDFYLDAFPAYAQPAAVPLNNVNLVGMDFPVDRRWMRRLYSFGNRMTSVGKIDNQEAYLEERRQLRADVQRESGLRVSIGLDRYARDPRKEAGYGITEGWDTAFLWENVRDALILTPDGEPVDSWSGMAVNLSPEFSYGRRVLDRLYARIPKHDYDGVWYDYYNDGEGYDPSHRYRQLPFYPTLVSDTRFNRELAEWLHARGRFFALNGPAPGLCFNRYYDMVSIDATPALMLRYKLQAAYKPFVALGGSTPRHPFCTDGWLEGGFRSFFFGGAVPAWAFGSLGSDAVWCAVSFIVDVERARPLFARNAFLGTRLASSVPLGGDFTTYRWAAYGHPEGSIYLPVLNITDQRLRSTVAISHPRFPLRAGRRYALIEWDLEQGARILSRGRSGAELRDVRLEAALEPGEIRIFAIEPDEDDALVTPYCAFVGDAGPGVASATDEVVQAARDGGRARFHLRGLDGAQFEVQVATGGLSQVHLQVRGLRAGCIRRRGERVRIWGEQSGPLDITLAPSSFPGSSLLTEGHTYRIRDDFRRARAVYRQTTAAQGWQLAGGWTTDGNPLEGHALVLASPTPQPAEALLDLPLGLHHELTLSLARLAFPEPQWGQLLVEFPVAGAAGDEYAIRLESNRTVLLHNGEPTSGEPGMHLCTYPTRYHRYVRDYGFRIRRHRARIAFAVSYDGGDSWETLGEWQLPRPDLTPRLGVRLTGTAARLDQAVVLTP